MANEQPQTFDAVAELYDRARPSYPKILVDDVLSFAHVSDPGRILEIGCGTGHATRLFAERGHSLQCIEPGASLYAVASRNLARYEGVSISHAGWRTWLQASDIIAVG